MAMCYFNNINCCYYPAHTSHGLQPLDNGPYNALKTAYRKQLSRLSSLTDSAPVDKINFIRCYAAARSEAFTKKNIESGFRVTGNWPISRRKAFIHPEIQLDKDDRGIRPISPPLDSNSGGAAEPPNTPTNARQIKDLGVGQAPIVRRLFQKAATAFNNKVMECILKDERIRSLEAQIERLQPKKRRKIPNPNRTFMTLAECLSRGLDSTLENVYEVVDLEDEAIQGGQGGSEGEDNEEEEPLEEELPPPVHTRSGRTVQRPSRYND